MPQAGVVPLTPAVLASLTSAARTTPVADQAAPSVLSLRFSERVLLSGSLIEVTDSSGRPVAVGVPQLSAAPGGSVSASNASGAGSPRAGPGAGAEGPVVVSAALPPLSRGSYRVSWSMISSDDLHPTPAGYAQYRRQWADAMATAVYGL